jgi:hypothetical protein
MREEVGAASVSDAAGWSRIVFIAIVCALGGIGFLAATILMNGRALSFLQPPTAVAALQAATPVPAAPAEPAAPAAKPKPAANDRFQPIDVLPRGDINKATLARCRSHVEAGRAFESLSLKRMSEMRESRKAGEYDPEAMCRDHLSSEFRQGANR